ncbi:hypothetical protein niasHS_017938 [Heterodera schachtii]|uniref:Uncharacterized protein n=2 Tax=Heterodera TaxID=34509 RepID=A0ABD2HX98_HETSC
MELLSQQTAPVDVPQKHWHQINDENGTEACDRQNNGRRCCFCLDCRRRHCSFTISPIDGMEWLQQCHPSYGVDGDLSAKRFMEEKKLNLSRRFQLIERGYVLKLKNDGGEGPGGGKAQRRRCSKCGCKGSLFDQLTVRLIAGSEIENDGKTTDEEEREGEQQKRSGGEEAENAFPHQMFFIQFAFFGHLSVLLLFSLVLPGTAIKCFSAIRINGTPDKLHLLVASLTGGFGMNNTIECHNGFGCMTHKCDDESGNAKFVINGCAAGKGNSDCAIVVPCLSPLKQSCEICESDKCNKDKIELNSFADEKKRMPKDN